MKELLYIPSGKYVRFFKIPYVGILSPLDSIEAYTYSYNKIYKTSTSIQEIIEAVSHIRFYTKLYTFADIDIVGYDEANPIPLSYFELVADD
jgi:hypothetical protein